MEEIKPRLYNMSLGHFIYTRNHENIEAARHVTKNPRFSMDKWNTSEPQQPPPQHRIAGGLLLPWETRLNMFFKICFQMNCKGELDKRILSG